MAPFPSFSLLTLLTLPLTGPGGEGEPPCCPRWYPRIQATATCPPTFTQTFTPNWTLTPTPTDTPTVTDTPTPTFTPTPTPTDTPTNTPTNTPVGFAASGCYTGDGVDNRVIEIGFKPDFVAVQAVSTSVINGYARFTGMAPDLAIGFSSGGTTSNTIQNFVDTGFEIGTHGGVNQAGTTYCYWATKESPNVKVSSYTGNGADNRNITGVGFSPEFVWIQRQDSAWSGMWRPASITGDASCFIPPTSGNCASANRIQALQSDGFQVGNDVRVNASGGTYRYLAINFANGARGSISYGSYTGTGTFETQQITTDCTTISMVQSYGLTGFNCQGFRPRTGLSGTTIARYGQNQSSGITPVDGSKFDVTSSCNAPSDTFHWAALCD